MEVTEEKSWSVPYYYLGSLTLITNASGAQIERLAYEAYGKRRNPNGTDDPANTLYGITTDRGFTGHEHLDEVALIHMNGRIYDPLIARFMTPDPYVQSPALIVGYNRYAYGLDNPLSGVDPSGYGFFSDLFSPITDAWHGVWRSDVGRVAVTVAVAYFTGQMVGNWLTSSAIQSGTSSAFANITFLETQGVLVGTSLTPAGMAIAGAGSGFAVGVVAGGNLESGLRGAASGAILGGVDGYFGNTWSLERVAAKSFAGGIAASIQGGRFEDGLLNSGINSGVRYLYSSLVGYDVTAARGENRIGATGGTDYIPDRSPDNFGRLKPEDIGRNIIGFNENYEGQNCSFCRDAFRQGGPVSRALNIAPGVNAIGGLDDYFNNRAPTSLGESQWFKAVTIPASVIVTVPALLDRVPLYRPQDPFGRRR